MLCFGWHNGCWLYKQRTDKRVMFATDMDDVPSPVEFFNHAIANKVVEVWQAPNGSMAEYTKVLV